MNSNTYKILVVDDDPDIVELLKYNLSSEGYKVKSASNGSQAVSLAREFIPDLTILDIMMPNMDGVETCRQIRSIPELANKFIIFLTARSEEYSEIAAFEMGADDYITKPIKPRALISRINALFSWNSNDNLEKSSVRFYEWNHNQIAISVEYNKGLIEKK